MMMGYGQFVFGLDTLAYQELERASEWRHPTNSRVGARPAAQFLGPGPETITLTGLLAPLFKGSSKSLDLLREMANTGQAWPLVAGSGRVYGAYVITALREVENNHLADGTATRIQFTVGLQRVDDDATDQLGTSTSADLAR